MTTLFDKGLAVRKDVLGAEYVENSIKNADDFNRPLQELVTEYCWGAIWTREGLPRKTRSMLNLAMLATLNRPHELELHIRGAMREVENVVHTENEREAEREERVDAAHHQRIQELLCDHADSGK